MSGSPIDSSAENPTTAAPVSVAALVLPVVVSILALLVIFLFVSHDAAVEVLYKAFAVATVAGKFAVLLADPDKFLKTPQHMAVLIVYMDCLFGLICAFNIRVLFRIPGFGNKLLEIQDFCRLMLRKNPWMGKATFFGTSAFVMFPLSGTGAIGASLLGQILGMSRRRTLLAIFVGAAVGSFGLAALVDFLPAGIQNSWAFKIGGLVVILGLVALLTRLYKKVGAAAESSESSSPEPYPPNNC